MAIQADLRARVETADRLPQIEKWLQTGGF